MRVVPALVVLAACPSNDTLPIPAFPFVDTGTWTATDDDVTIMSDGLVDPYGAPYQQRFATCREGDRLDLDLQGGEVPLLRYTLVQ
jgi:hypothetical protein